MQLALQLGAGQRMRIPSDQVSTPTYAPDLGHAIAALAGGTAAGVLHVAGPDVLARSDFARRAAGLLGLDRSLIDAVPTAVLGQKAPRPLSAGLRTDRLAALGIAMRGVDEGVRAFLGARRSRAPGDGPSAI